MSPTLNHDTITLVSLAISAVGGVTGFLAFRNTRRVRQLQEEKHRRELAEFAAGKQWADRQKVIVGLALFVLDQQFSDPPPPPCSRWLFSIDCTRIGVLGDDEVSAFVAAFEQDARVIGVAVEGRALVTVTVSKIPAAIRAVLDERCAHRSERSAFPVRRPRRLAP